jgi:hypothetical protein
MCELLHYRAKVEGSIDAVIIGQAIKSFRI